MGGANPYFIPPGKAMLVQQTATDGTPGIQATNPFVRSVHYVEWGANVTAGAVQIQSAKNAEYTGTWDVIATIPFTAAGDTVVVNVDAPHGALKHVVSTTVTNDGGGTAATQAVNSWMQAYTR